MRSGFVLAELAVALTLVLVVVFGCFAVLARHGQNVRELFEERAAIEAAWAEVERFHATGALAEGPAPLVHPSLPGATVRSAWEPGEPRRLTVTVAWKDRSVRVSSVAP